MNINPDFNQNLDWQQQSRESLSDAVLLTTSLVEQYLKSLASESTRHTRKLESGELASKLASLKSAHHAESALANLIFQLELSDTEIFILLVLVAAELVPF